MAMTRRDIRDTALFKEIEALCRDLRAPGTGRISDAAELHVSPTATHAIFTATMAEKLEGVLATRICRVNLRSSEVQVLTFGPNTDRLGKYSPSGMHIAFLSDRAAVGNFQLFLLDPNSGVARAAPVV